MTDFANRVRASLWWLGPLVVCAVLIAWETDLGRAVRKLPPPAEAIPPRPVVTALLPEYAVAGGIAARSDTVQRTLFNPTRRPAPVAVVDATKPRMQRGQFALTGTTVIDGKSTAFLREVAAGKSRRVQQGETVNGMMVAEVKPDRVRLALGDESEELFLRVATNPRPTAQPAAPAPVPVAAGTAAPPPAAPLPAANAAAASAAEASLAERRRAARAAQSAIQAQTSTPDGNPLPAPAPAKAQGGIPTSQQAVPAATTAPAPGDAPDPRWAEVYKAYQQRTPYVPK